MGAGGGRGSRNQTDNPRRTLPGGGSQVCSPEGRCVPSEDEWDVAPAGLVFMAPPRPPCEEPTSATLQEGAVLEGRPRQGPRAGGVRVFLASTHSQWLKF